jgi:hypothetical protein
MIEDSTRVLRVECKAWQLLSWHLLSYQNGVLVAKFSLATNERFKDKTGEY